LLANQSLKLTEITVDDFAARCWTNLGTSDWNVRATNYMELAARRRRLAPVRYASLAAGGFCIKEIK
jgi:hypothetical protein